MLCPGSVGPFQSGWTDGDRQAVVGEGERSPRTKRDGAGREHRETARRSTVPTLTIRELAEMTGGEALQNPDLRISSIVIDSREVKPDSVFFAIKGERLD